jgi:hypothetical protein
MRTHFGWVECVAQDALVGGFRTKDLRMNAMLRVEQVEERLTPAVTIDTAYDTYAWVLINSLRQNPTAFANTLDGLRAGSVSSAFGFTKSDAIIADLKTMISNASVPAHYQQSLSMMRSTAPAGAYGWDDLLESRADNHNEWMKVNGFEHTDVNSGHRMALPGFTKNDTAPADTWGYSGQFSWYGEDIGFAVGSLQSTKAAYNSGAISLAGLQQRAAFLDTVAYMLELNSNSFGHLQNLLGRDSGSDPALPSFNAIGIDVDLYEAPAMYEVQDGVPEAWVSTHRLGFYQPGGTGGYISGIAYVDQNKNGYFDVGESSSVTVVARNASGGGFTDTLTSADHGAFSEYVPNGTYTVTTSANGVVLDSHTVTVNNSNAWAEFALSSLSRPTLNSPIGAQNNFRPTVTWTAVGSATGYQVRIDDNTSGITNFLNGNASGTSWTPSADLRTGRAYRVFVRALQGTTAGPWSDYKEFSIAMPTKSGPSGTTPNLRPTFSWSALSAATYQIRIDDLSSLKYDIFPKLTVSNTSWQPPTDLASWRTYRWEIRAMNSLDQGSWSGWTTFNIPRPTLTGPAATIADLRPTLSWTAITGAAYYEVRLNDVSANTFNIFPGTHVTSLSWTPSTVLVSGHYYSWQVRAANAFGQGSWSAIGQFRVTQPTLSAPIGTITDDRPVFGWTAVSGTTTYQIAVSDLTSGKTVAKLPVNGLNWTPSADLVAVHRYRWWVRALNLDEQGVSSVAVEFSVV